MTGMFIGLLLAAIQASPGLAQDAAPKLEVASIKFHPGPITHSADPRVQGRRVVATASKLTDLITSAYGVRYDQIVGEPAWASSDHYDIEAQAEGGAVPTAAQAKLIVQQLLAERFQLKLHRETREEPVYFLVVAGNGPKLKPADPNARPGTSTRADNKGLHLRADNATLPPLVSQMTYSAGHPIVDKTGLTGQYSYTLDWWPPTSDPPADSDVPSLFAALQEQLGLKLEPGKGPVEKLVIDHVEKPSSN